MRRVFVTAIATLSLAFVVTPQDEASKAKVSAAPLTEEQVAVYRAVLDGYSNGSSTALTRKVPSKRPSFKCLILELLLGDFVAAFATD